MNLNTPCTGGTLMDVPQDRRCGARTRAGAPCKNWSMRGRTRCRMHGGRSLRGIASPTFKHGRYSRDMVAFLLWRLGYSTHDPDARERQYE
jgi:hypothetical protein